MSVGTDTPLTGRLSRLLAAEPDIALATVFGSIAEDRPRVDSDLDIAVLTDRPLTAERKQQLIKLLAMESGRPVDLVDLQNCRYRSVTLSAIGGDKKLLPE